MKNNCREMVYLFFFTLVEVYLGASGSILEFHSFIGCIFTRDCKCVGNIDETDFSTATALSRGRKRSVSFLLGVCCFRALQSSFDLGFRVFKNVRKTELFLRIAKAEGIS